MKKIRIKICRTKPQLFSYIIEKKGMIERGLNLPHHHVFKMIAGFLDKGFKVILINVVEHELLGKRKEHKDDLRHSSIYRSLNKIPQYSGQKRREVHTNQKHHQSIPIEDPKNRDFRARQEHMGSRAFASDRNEHDVAKDS